MIKNILVYSSIGDICTFFPMWKHDNIQYAFNYYGNDTKRKERIASSCDYFSHIKGTKFNLFSKLFGALPLFDYYVLLDDDLNLTGADIMQMIEKMDALGYGVGSPSHSPDGSMSWSIMKTQQNSEYRSVDFVEMTGVIFNQQEMKTFLDAYTPYADQMVSFGVDYIIHSVCNKPFVIFDNVSVVNPTNEQKGIKEQEIETYLSGQSDRDMWEKVLADPNNSFVAYSPKTISLKKRKTVPKVNIDSFLKSLKKKKVHAFQSLTSATKKRLEQHGLTVDYINSRSADHKPDSDVLVIDFNTASFEKDCESVRQHKYKYKKILLIDFLVTDYNGHDYSDDLAKLPQHTLVEALDDYSDRFYSKFLLGQFVGEPDDVANKVSVVCACMNRNDILRVNIMSWLHFSEIGEIVVVDWSSDQPLDYLTKLDPRIKVIRVEGQKQFNISQAFNLAIDNTSLEYVLKLDTDYFLNPYYNFFKHHPMNSGVFYAGNWNIDPELPAPIFQHLAGLCYVQRDVLASINGYNEHFSGYGYDDSDLRIRLQSVHVGKLLPIKYDYSVMHTPHENSLRIVHYTDSQYNVSNNKETAKNMGIAPSRVRSWTIKNTPNPNYFLAHDPTL